jgi:hypothetical protein
MNHDNNFSVGACHDENPIWLMLVLLLSVIQRRYFHCPLMRSELREMQSQTIACFVSGKKLDKFHLNKELNGSGEKKAYHFMLHNEEETDRETDSKNHERETKRQRHRLLK